MIITYIWVLSYPFLNQTHESDSLNIAQRLKDFSQQEIVPTTYVLEELINHLAGELSYDHNPLAYISDSEQP